MGKSYKNPPIVEVIVEFQFDDETTWDLVVPGQIYDALKDSYTTKRRSSGVNVAFEKSQQTAQLTAAERVQFIHKNEKILIQVAPHLLTVHHLRPYTSWVDFVPFIREAFLAYSDITNASQLLRIKVRYINLIKIPYDSFAMEEYFKLNTNIPAGFPDTYVSFIIGKEFIYNEPTSKLKIQLSSAVNTEDEQNAYIALDIENTCKPESLRVDDILSLLSISHDRIEDAFEACITDSTRSIFNEELK